MSTCPHCAEELGWRQLLRKEPCAYCRLALHVDEKGRLKTFAVAHRSQILEAPLQTTEWRWIAVAVVATGLVSLVPSFGALPLLVLPMVQAGALEKLVRRFKQHLGFRHRITTDVFSGLFVTMLIATQALLNGFLGPFAAATNPVLLVLGALVLWSYARWHFDRESRKVEPALLEMVILLGIFGLLVLPPTLLFAGVLYSVFWG